MSTKIRFGNEIVDVPSNVAGDISAAMSRSKSSCGTYTRPDGGGPLVKIEVTFSRKGMGATATYHVKIIHELKVDLVTFTKMMKAAGLGALPASGSKLAIVCVGKVGTATTSTQTPQQRAEAQKAAEIQKMTETQKLTAPQAPRSSGGGVPTLPSDTKPGYPITQVGTTAQKLPAPDDFVPSTPEDVDAANEIVETGVDPTEGMSTMTKAGIAVGGLALLGGVGYWFYSRR